MWIGQLGETVNWESCHEDEKVSNAENSKRLMTGVTIENKFSTCSVNNYKKE